MADNTPEFGLTHRRGFEAVEENGAENTAETSKQEEMEEEEEKVKQETQEKTVEVGGGAWQTVKHYFNRFRYYHFVVADTVDKYASAALLWLINMYMKYFMGVGPEAPSVLTEPT